MLARERTLNAVADEIQILRVDDILNGFAEQLLHRICSNQTYCGRIGEHDFVVLVYRDGIGRVFH